VSWPPPTPEGPAYTYRAACHRVVDGDTFIADVDLGFNVLAQIAVRIHGVNAPEKRTPQGPAATDFLRLTLGEPPEREPKSLLLSSLRGDVRSFARWVCDVWVEDEALGPVVLVAQTIIANGHGVPMMQ
jgi:endonuclease YncB( thermonuclease family)